MIITIKESLQGNNHHIARPGNAFCGSLKLIKHFYPNTQVQTISDNNNENVFLAFNRDNTSVKNRILLLGTYGKNKKLHLNEAKHIVCISKFQLEILKKLCNFNKYKVSIIPEVGPMPRDKNMTPVDIPKKLGNPIQFVIVAKWHKRRFKRLMPIIDLFNTMILPRYPNSILNVIGAKRTVQENNVFFYRMSFNDKKLVDVFKNSHIHITLSAIDTGPATITQAMHYKIPFICTENCGYKDLINRVSGTPGVSISIDPVPTKPSHAVRLTKQNRHLNEEQKIIAFKAIQSVIENYDHYMNWSFTKDFNYRSLAKQWMKILKH